MAGNPADERFRPPDPPLETGNPTNQSKNQDVVDSASSSSSQRREEAVHVATIEADIDASRHNIEQDLNLSCKEGEIERSEK